MHEAVNNNERCSIADPYSGWVKSQDPDPGSGSGMKTLDHISKSLETLFWVKILKFFIRIRDPGIFLTQDPGIFLTLNPAAGIRDWKNSDPDKHPGSAILER